MHDQEAQQFLPAKASALPTSITKLPSALGASPTAQSLLQHTGPPGLQMKPLGRQPTTHAHARVPRGPTVLVLPNAYAQPAVSTAGITLCAE